MTNCHRNGHILHSSCGSGGSVGIATNLRARRSGDRSRWGREFPHLSGPARGLTQPPVLHLLAVLPVQSLSACTVQLHLYSPYVPYSLYRASVPVQSLSACTRVHFNFLPLHRRKHTTFKTWHKFEIKKTSQSSSSVALQLWKSLGLLDNSLPLKAALYLFCPLHKLHLLQIIPHIIIPSSLGPSSWSSCE